MRQVHGAGIVVVTPGSPQPGGKNTDEELPSGDALVSAVPDRLAVLVADCAPVAMASEEGVIAAVHCGWRGVVAGVIQSAANAMRSQGASRIEAVVGPCIGPECYPFGLDDLAAAEASMGGKGSGVRSATPDGAAAFDLRSAVRAACRIAQVTVVEEIPLCTACDARYYSARARGEQERQAGLVWRDE